MPLVQLLTPPRLPGRRLLKDRAQDSIRAAILRGDFRAGERLDHRALQEWLGTSRTPIRDALNALATEGLVDIRAQSHTSVISADPGEGEDSLETLGVLMGGVIRLTLPALDDEQLGALDARVADAQQHVVSRDLYAHTAAVHLVFTYLLDRCPNRVLEHRTRSALTPLLYRARVAAQQRTPHWVGASECWSLLRAAIESRDAHAAEAAVKQLHHLPADVGRMPSGA
ncbi:DNA-binding GntR family transcriptional regulator [Leucobacter komagatae]|uniref:DNA-binding GntR family transcriptional regulator n=1 Tax=Leucobacter komagatae TaxID=55969 RepID=A0A542Y9T3_9MICO|nr:GntR family transcriptional regulator [Leucobacter komagatae]TQL44841.1 DNA-binding GntR family transcriptional regulator [Leucobacter komagatae]